MKKPFNFFRKSFLINQLMQLYSLILIAVLMVIVIGLSLFVVKTKFDDAQMTADNISVELVNNIKNKDSSIVTSVLDEIAVSSLNYDNMYHFLTLNQEQYFLYVQNQWEEKDDIPYFPFVLRSLLLNHSEIASIDIVFDDYEEYLHADKSNVMGKKKKKPYIDPSNVLTIVRSIKEPNTAHVMGAVYVTFTEESLVSSYNEIQNNQSLISSFILDSKSELIHIHGSNMSKKDLLLIKEGKQNGSLKKSYYIKKASVRDLSIIVLINKSDFRKMVIKPVLLIILVGLSTIILLLFFLNKLFKKYSIQMKEIVNVTNQISNGNLNAQVNTNIMELELKDLAEAINLMVINLNNYIEDIYLLEIKQKDAHMKALQAQINPHFLYNTLEYIRMYALSNQQNELADVVYSFSALLRNNITDEKTTSLKKELNFCEKYVYLYQMRYPESIAYHFIVDDKLEDFIIPKFIIQPLIENYFIHGIDFERQDNAISVKAQKKDNNVEIRITDNGNGMTNAQINDLNRKLVNRISMSESIGISNVYERLKGYFGSSAEMWIEKGSNRGIVVILKIKNE